MSTLLISAACDPPGEHNDVPEVGGDEDELQFRTTYGAGTGANPPVYGNTSALGNTPFTELDSAGALHEGTRLLGVYPWNPASNAWDVAPFSEVWIEVDGELRARRGATYYSGSQLQGSRWLIGVMDANGALVTRQMFVQTYTHDQQGHRYVLSYPDQASYGLHASGSSTPRLPGARRSACVPDENGSLEAVLLGGRHVDLTTSAVSQRSNTLMFACLSGALGKALRWGYRPGVGPVDNEAYQSAIHMVRADYCGDGVSWTEPGQLIDLRDSLVVNNWHAPGQFTATEAVWGPDGALCLGTPRLQAQFTASDIQCPNGPLPACNELQAQSIFNLEGSIWTRIAPL